MDVVSGNIYMRKHVGLPKGNVVDGHTHNFDHTTIVFKGAVHVSAVCPDGRIIERDFQAPTHFLVKKDVRHEITVLKDGTEYWCVYSHRTAQGDIVQEDAGWGDAYG